MPCQYPPCCSCSAAASGHAADSSCSTLFSHLEPSTAPTTKCRKSAPLLCGALTLSVPFQRRHRNINNHSIFFTLLFDIASSQHCSLHNCPPPLPLSSIPWNTWRETNLLELRQGLGDGHSRHAWSRDQCSKLRGRELSPGLPRDRRKY